MIEEELNCIIVIDDSNDDNFFINYLFSKIDDIGNSANTLHRYFFWRSIRRFIEFKHRMISNDNMRVKLLSGNIYNFACYQEMMFEKIEF